MPPFEDLFLQRLIEFAGDDRLAELCQLLPSDARIVDEIVVVGELENDVVKPIVLHELVVPMEGNTKTVRNRDAGHFLVEHLAEVCGL